MNNLISFAYESGVCMAVLVGMYWIFMQRETYFRFNRMYLLGTVLFACIIPLGNLNPFVITTKTSTFNAITSMGLAIRIPEVTITNGSTKAFSLSNNWHHLVIVVYLLGVLLLLARIILGIIRINGLKKNGRRMDHDGYSVVYIKQQLSPFSFFKTIFINESLMNSSEKSNIIDHEVIHIRQLHSYDKLIIEIFLAVLWFNPFIWFIKRSLRNTHEYLADNGIEKTKSNLIKYQSLLLKQIHVSSPLIVTNSFNSMIKNRIKMMYKRKSTVLAKLKPLLLVPVVLCLTLIFACSDSDNELQMDNLTAEQANLLKSDDNNKTLEEVFSIVEEMPSFQGAGIEGFRIWIANNLIYPEKAYRDSVSGRVYVQFIVNSLGEVTNAIVVKGVHPDLDAEALRVVESSPVWIPGKQRGKNVAVRFTFPINFVLN